MMKSHKPWVPYNALVCLITVRVIRMRAIGMRLLKDRTVIKKKTECVMNQRRIDGKLTNMVNKKFV